MASVGSTAVMFKAMEGVVTAGWEVSATRREG